MNVIAFVDHEIGFRLLRLMLTEGYRDRLTVRAVVTSPENGAKWWPGVADLAGGHGLPLLRYPADRARLGGFGGVDYFLLLSWKYLLPPQEFAIPGRGTINLHYSLLPKYRGVYPVNWVIMRGEKETGVTFHRVGQDIDAGPVICQARLAIQAEDTARSLQLRLDDLACDSFGTMVRRLELGETEPGLAGVDAQSEYFSRNDFLATDMIDLDATYRGRELIDLLRGKTFLPHGRNAYFTDPATGRKIHVSLDLKPEP